MEKRTRMPVLKYFRAGGQLPHFFGVFLCAVFLFAVILYGYTVQLTAKEYTLIKNAEMLHLELGKHTFLMTFEELRKDTFFLAESATFQAFLLNPNGERKEQIKNGFSVFSSNRKRYDQVRYLDNRGMEVVRVDLRNGKATSIAENQLQDKSDRYYFKESIGMSRGEFYLSPLDLNIERGVIDRPYKPMLRIITAAIDKDNRNHGVVILNFLAENLINAFKGAFRHHENDLVHTRGRPLILNQDGYFLLAENSEDEWGFMFGKESLFPLQNPAVWSLIQQQAKGQLRTSDGFFSFVKVYPLEEKCFPGSSGPLPPAAEKAGGKGQDYYWILASHVPADKLNQLISIPRRFPWLLYLSILILSSPLLWFYVTIKASNQQIEERLRKREKLLLEAQEIAHIGHWKYDLSSSNYEWSDEMYRILGREPGIIPPSWRVFLKSVHQDDRKRVWKVYKKTRKSGEKGHLLYRLLLPDNTEKYVDAKWSTVLDQQGKPSLFFGTLQDITGQKQMEDLLMQSEKMTTIAGLAAGVAHEINTPLSAILQSAQIIEQGLDEDRAKNRELASEYGLDLARINDYLNKKEIGYFLTGIRDSALSASHIINNLLQFSRPINGDITQVNIAELLDNAVQLSHADYDLRKNFDILKLDIKKEYDPELPAVPCVAMEISQVMLNLIKNAAQALGEEVHGESNKGLRYPEKKQKKGLLTLRTLRVDDRVRIEVEDNGPGMSDEVRRHVFDPFYTTKDVGEGTGLGLSVAYAIICDKHKGRLWVESEPGRGTKFVVELALTGNEWRA